MFIFKNIAQVVQKKLELQSRLQTIEHVQRRSAFVLKVVMLGGLLMTSAYAKGKADQYIHTSLQSMFGNTEQFECDGANLSAVCTAKHFDIPNTHFSLHNFRYTVNYRDTRVAERLSGDVVFDGNHDLKDFMPKHFECADFTQVSSEKQRVSEQVVCTFDTEAYRLWMRVRANATSPLFVGHNSLTLLQKMTMVLDGLAKQNIENKKDFEQNFADIRGNILHKIDLNLYGIDVAITRSQLPQKVFNLLFEDMLVNDMIAQDSDGQDTKLAQTLYNSGIAYMYGYAMGYVWGNSNITDRTKDGLRSLFGALRDFTMLDTNIKALHVTIINRTREGVNLAHFVDSLVMKFDDIKKLRKDRFGELFELLDDDVLNRYRIEVQALRGKTLNR